MLLVNNGKPHIIDDSRIYSEHGVIIDYENDSQLRYKCEVYVDGMKLMDATPVYIDHKQYKEFIQNFDINSIHSIFGATANLAFYDMGTKENKDTEENKDNGVYKDYSEKAYEGVSYFSDIISEDDKKCTFKQNYKRVGVRL